MTLATVGIKVIKGSLTVLAVAADKLEQYEQRLTEKLDAKRKAATRKAIEEVNFLQVCIARTNQQCLETNQRAARKICEVQAEARTAATLAQSIKTIKESV
jgi:hypothetical protein